MKEIQKISPYVPASSPINKEELKRYFTLTPRVDAAPKSASRTGYGSVQSASNCSGKVQKVQPEYNDFL